MKLHRYFALALLAVLVAVSLVPDVFLSIAGRRARPEHIAAPIVFATFVLSCIVARQRPIRIDAFSVLAAGWVALNGVSSWLYAPDLGESLVHVVRMGLLGAIFLTVANLPFRQGSAWVTGFRLWLGLAAVELAYGFAVWLLAHYAGVWLPGAYYEPHVAGIGIKGTQFERNLFGILAGTVLIVTAYILPAQRGQAKPRVASTRLLAAGCALGAAAVVVSLTRSAWIAVVAAAPVAYIVFDRRRPARADRALIETAAGVPVILILTIALVRILPTPAPTHAPPASAALMVASSPPTGAPATVVADRVSTLAQLESDFTTNTRLQDARWALQDWRRSPILGHGTGSFGQIHGHRVGTEAWISNLILHTMVDTGLVGLAIQVTLFGLVAIRAWRASQITTDARLAVGLRALTMGFLVMLLAYQVTDGTWLAVFWVHLGLMVNGIYRVLEST